MKHLDQLANVLGQYDVLFCDVWGVLHNGVHVFAKAERALNAARAAGKCVILITNSPRPKMGVEDQLADIGVDPDCYNDIVTSGDVTRDLIREAPRRIFLIGPDRDLSLFDGLDAELVEEFEADAVVVTGLFDDEHETPDDYSEMLQRLRARDLPLICANPDIVVERGKKVLWCAGALARDYTMLGGRTFVAGKPHYPIYDLAMKKATAIIGSAPDQAKILAIGDGILTDVKGAYSYGIDALFIAGGIHAGEYADKNSIDRKRLDAFVENYGIEPTFYMMELG